MRPLFGFITSLPENNIIPRNVWVLRGSWRLSTYHVSRHYTWDTIQIQCLFTSINSVFNSRMHWSAIEIRQLSRKSVTRNVTKWAGQHQPSGFFMERAVFARLARFLNKFLKTYSALISSFLDSWVMFFWLLYSWCFWRVFSQLFITQCVM